ncbi:MAG: PilZ domain-containing protein [Treponema sp.]|nr:PilZ domain-containing protein [Treponema sp.]
MEISYNQKDMNEDNRQDTRYCEIGRVIAPELCALNGILDDISLTGCKIHFPCIFQVNLDEEYNLKIALSRSPEDEPLQLLCRPIWIQHGATDTYIGMQNMYSPDENRLKGFIDFLEQLDTNDIPDII